MHLHTWTHASTVRLTYRAWLVLGLGVPVAVRHAVRGCEVVWALREESIGTAYFDAVAAQFLVERLHGAVTVPPGDAAALTAALGPDPTTTTATATAATTVGTETRTLARVAAAGGPSLGPDWQGGAALQGAAGTGRVVLLPLDEVVRIDGDAASERAGHHDGDADHGGSAGGWPLHVHLASGRAIGCDVAVSATGVIPATAFLGPEARLPAILWPRHTAPSLPPSLASLLLRHFVYVSVCVHVFV
jgi:pyridine nucleotide-disulfide oxidoreductase domain-containing protein 1